MVFPDFCLRQQGLRIGGERLVLLLLTLLKLLHLSRTDLWVPQGHVAPFET